MELNREWLLNGFRGDRGNCVSRLVGRVHFDIPSACGIGVKTPAVESGIGNGRRDFLPRPL